MWGDGGDADIQIKPRNILSRTSEDLKTEENVKQHKNALTASEPQRLPKLVELVDLGSGWEVI